MLSPLRGPSLEHPHDTSEGCGHNECVGGYAVTDAAVMTFELLSEYGRPCAPQERGAFLRFGGQFAAADDQIISYCLQMGLTDLNFYATININNICYILLAIDGMTQFVND